MVRCLTVDIARFVRNRREDEKEGYQMHMTRNGFTLTLKGEYIVRNLYPLLTQQFCDTVLFDRAIDAAMERETQVVNDRDVEEAWLRLRAEVANVFGASGIRVPV